jgi:Mrp family chromosome partitioning ATPase
VILMVGSSKVKLPDLQKSLSSLEMVEADLLGVVLNFLPAKGPDAYAYNYYSYEPATVKGNSRSSSASRNRRRQKAGDTEVEERLQSRAL